jgi:hypothetical protein
MIAKHQATSSNTTRNLKQKPRSQAKKPLPEELTLLAGCPRALLLVLLSINAHLKPTKTSQMGLGIKMSRYRKGKISSRTTVNEIVKLLVDMGILEHWGYWHDTHWYKIADKYKSFFTELAYQQKLEAFNQLSLLHSAPESTDVEKPTLYIYLNSTGELLCSERKMAANKNTEEFVPKKVLESLSYEPRDEDAPLRYKMACKETLLVFKKNIEDIMAIQEASDLADGYVEYKGYDPFETEDIEDSIYRRFKHFPDILL